MLIVKRVERNKARPYGTSVCGVDLQFDFLTHDNEVVLGCYVADDAKGDEIARTLAKVPLYDVLRGVEKPKAKAPHGRWEPAAAPPRALSILVELGILASVEPHDLSADEYRKMNLVQELVDERVNHIRHTQRVVEERLDETPPQRGSGFFETKLPAGGDVSPVYETARANGWEPLDLVGTGGPFGDPGPAGGYSPLTGLTLAQMALCVPPARWGPEMAAKVYPWEVEGWKRPGLDWIPPVVPLKVPQKAADEREADLLHSRTPKGDRPKDLDPDGSRDEEPGEVLDPDGLAEANASGRVRSLSKEESDAINERMERGEPTPTFDPAVVAGYPEAHVDAVRALAHSLAKAAGSKPLHHNKINWAIRTSNEEHNLDVPTVTADQLAALLAVPPTTTT